MRAYTQKVKGLEMETAKISAIDIKLVIAVVVWLSVLLLVASAAA